jgi:transcriptional regulator with XRE-family HTH domain
MIDGVPVRRAVRPARRPGVSRVARSDPLDSFHVRKVREPTRLGRFILERMAAHGMQRQVDLVRASDQVAESVGADSGISDSTVSRLLYSDSYMPDRDTLVVLAATLQVDYRGLVLFVYEQSAGPPEATSEPIPPLALEIGRMLAQTSPVPEERRKALEVLLGRVIDPERKYMRRRRPA